MSFARVHDDQGFSLVEIMVAAVIMVGGLLALGDMMLHSSTATWSTKAREQGVALQRELVESARAIPYENLVPASIVGTVQSGVGSGLADSGEGAGWTVRRRGFTYTVSLGVCSVDDPADGVGAHDGASFCASGASTTSPEACAAAIASSGSGGDCGLDTNGDGTVDGLTEADAGICVTGICTPTNATDTTPSDYKRIVSLVQWERGTGKRYALQSSTVPNPGLSTAPVVTALTPATSGTITSATSLAFTATIDRAAATVSWLVDGAHRGEASGSGTSWTFTWELGNVSAGSTPNSSEVLDGSYIVGAKAFDSLGTAGQTQSRTVVINRRAPYPPPQFAAGRNGGTVDFQWSPSPERDIVGYRVYRRPSTGSDVLVCTTTTKTACQDTSPPSAPSLNYFVVALDRDTAGNPREGAASPIDTVGLTNLPPSPPTSLVASTSGGNTILIWQASPGDPNAGDAVDHYRIYRDGTAYADRYDRTATSSQLSFVDSRTNGMPHTYWVVAVDRELAESTKLGPVTR